MKWEPRLCAHCHKRPSVLWVAGLEEPEEAERCDHCFTYCDECCDCLYTDLADTTKALWSMQTGFAIGNRVRRPEEHRHYPAADLEGTVVDSYAHHDGVHRIIVRWDNWKEDATSYKPHELEHARCTDESHPCVESRTVARDCFLSRRPGALP